MRKSPGRPGVDAGALARTLTQEVEFAAQGALRKLPTEETHGRLVAKIDGMLDEKLALVATPNVDCRLGCDACCHRVVFATVAEVEAVVTEVRARFTEEERAALRDRLRRYAEEVGPNQGRDLPQLRPACPFLVDRRCSVYRLRPIACRSQFSTDVAACESAKTDRSIPFPHTPAENAMGYAAVRGLSSALASSLGFGQPVDFGRLAYMLLEFGATGAPEKPHAFQFATLAPKPSPTPPPAGPAKYPVYRAGDEPFGIVEAADLTPSWYYLNEGDVERAFSVAPSTHPVHVLFRRSSPPVLAAPGDAEAGRERFARAFQAFAEMPADPRQKFDAISELPTLNLSYLQGDDRQLLGKIGDFETRELSAKLLPDLADPFDRPRRPGKLRVGYIGDLLNDSSSGYWASGWLRHHGLEIERYVFDLGLAPPSTDLYEKLADRFFHLPGAVPKAARLIRSHDLDVLIYPDLATRGRSILFATMRLARVQCAGWGGPGTTGLPNVDYFLSGDFLEPSCAQDHYREALVRLPRTGLCYPPLESQRLGFTKRDFGLDEGPLILCAQTPSKLLPEWDFLFREIGERTGRPIVFFRYPQWPHWVLERRLRAAGVRAIFLPVYSFDTFRCLLRLADVALDTVGWSGGITALETVGNGLPTVTWPGEFRKSRHTAGILAAANAPGLIAKDADDYVDLACNPDRRREATKDWDPAALFDDRAVVAALDRFLLDLRTE